MPAIRRRDEDEKLDGGFRFLQPHATSWWTRDELKMRDQCRVLLTEEGFLLNLALFSAWIDGLSAHRAPFRGISTALSQHLYDVGAPKCCMC